MGLWQTLYVEKLRSPYRHAMVQYCTTMQPRKDSLNFTIQCFLRTVKPMLLSVSPQDFPFQVEPLAMLVFSYSTHKGGNNPKRNPMWWRGLSNDVMSCVKPFLFVVLCLWDAGRWHGWDCVRGKGAGFRVNPQWLPVRFLELLPAPEFRRSGFG